MSEKRIIILFDLDGTLIDSTSAIYDSFCASFRAFHLPVPSFESVSAHIGKTLEDMFSALGVSKGSIVEIVNQYRIHYRSLMEQGTILLPSVKEALALASSFATLGVVTTKRGDFSKILLDKLGVGEHFSIIIGRENVTHPKPDSEPILKALEFLKYDSNKDIAYMVGDTMLDVLSARSAGIMPLVVTCGFGQDMDKSGEMMFENVLQSVEWIHNK